VCQQAALLQLQHQDDYSTLALWRDLLDWLRHLSHAGMKQPIVMQTTERVDYFAGPECIDDLALGFTAVLQATDDLPRTARVVLRMLALGANLAQAGDAANVTESRACQIARGAYGRVVVERLVTD
jgi:hypothetical protein